jgi:hypothetical protein
VRDKSVNFLRKQRIIYERVAECKD